jgi:Rrf2 family nitric oxide-sensitive transcriptional repressor
MHLTRHADYTMRLLVHLAIQPEGAATIREIADRYGISRNHLMKVANHATQAGYVKGVRGRAGGLQLAKSPRDLKVGQILRTVEDLNLVECFESNTNQCRITRGCGLQPILKEAVEAFLAVLDRYSLEDVVRRKPALIRLLELKSA